jgi:hypothetical protein
MQQHFDPHAVVDISPPPTRLRPIHTHSSIGIY